MWGSPWASIFGYENGRWSNLCDESFSFRHSSVYRRHSDNPITKGAGIGGSKVQVRSDSRRPRKIDGSR